MEAVALHDFMPNDRESELGFKKGDRLLILNYGDPVQWYNAEMNGQTGLVPDNYIELEQPIGWYLGRISRSTAEQILQGDQNDGAFLVRLSESSPTDFSLSVKCGNSVQHFRILRDQENQYFLWNTRFRSVNRLVEHYRTESVSRTATIVLCDRETKHLIVEALYDFKSADNQEEEAELEFQKGELITVFNNTDENWWGGRIGERMGYFPRSYVKIYEPSNIDFQQNHHMKLARAQLS